MAYTVVASIACQVSYGERGALYLTQRCRGECVQCVGNDDRARDETGCYVVTLYTSQRPSIPVSRLSEQHMMISYSGQDLEQWAAFSGDYNPVHFDDDVARSVGMPGRIVHGMLAMLTMKGHVPITQGGHSRVSFSIKKPMTLASQYKTTLDAGSLATHVYLTDIAEQERYIRCKYKAIKDDCFVDNDLKRHWVPEARLQRKRAAFQAIFQDVQQAWSFYDALIFNEYMDSINQSPHSLASALRELMPERVRPEMLEEAVVIHVFHDIRIHACLAGVLLKDQGRTPTVSYTVTLREVLGSDGALYVVLRFTCFFDDVPLLLTDMGLMVHAP